MQLHSTLNKSLSLFKLTALVIFFRLAIPTSKIVGVNAEAQFSSAAEAASSAAVQIHALTKAGPNEDGTGTWGDLGDLMGLLVRLPFHDAVTYNVTDGGSDGCVDLASAENKGLQEAIDLLEPIRLDASYGSDGEESYLSRADIWALAGNVMIEAAGGPVLEYKIGRVDVATCEGHGSRHVGSESTSSKETSKVFVDRLGFTPRQVTALIGAHVLGKTSKKNSGYEGKWVKDNTKFTNQYFIDLIHIPWIKQVTDDETFGKRTEWKRFGESMSFEDEIMLQTDVDLAFQTTGGRFCSRVGGEFRKETSCPNATHAFSSHVRDFALDQEAWFLEFALAWSKLTNLTNEELECVDTSGDCTTPGYKEPHPSSSWKRRACPLFLTLVISLTSFFY